MQSNNWFRLRELIEVELKDKNNALRNYVTFSTKQ